MRHAVVSPQYGQGPAGHLSATYECARGVPSPPARGALPGRAGATSAVGRRTSPGRRRAGSPRSGRHRHHPVSLAESRRCTAGGAEFDARYTFGANLDTIVNASRPRRVRPPTGPARLGELVGGPQAVGLAR